MTDRWFFQVLSEELVEIGKNSTRCGRLGQIEGKHDTHDTSTLQHKTCESSQYMHESSDLIHASAQAARYLERLRFKQPEPHAWRASRGLWYCVSSREMGTVSCPS